MLLLILEFAQACILAFARPEILKGMQQRYSDRLHCYICLSGTDVISFILASKKVLSLSLSIFGVAAYLGIEPNPYYIIQSRPLRHLLHRKSVEVQLRSVSHLFHCQPILVFVSFESGWF